MDFQITINDFPLLCRFCLSRSTELKPFSEIPSVSIFSIITGIEFKGMLPEKICSTCSQIFKNFEAFIKKCEQNSGFLKTIFEKSSTKNDSNNFDHEGDNCHSDEKMGEKAVGEVKLEMVLLKSDQNMKKYEKKEFTNKGRKCKNCNKQFLSLKLLSEHYKKSLGCAPKGLKLGCKTCGKKFIEKRHLNHHYSESQECMPKPTMLNCACGLTFISKRQLDAHHKEKPSCQPKDYSCAHCTKTFNRHHRLVTHMRSHTKEAPFECKECGKKFRFQQNLRRHILIHKGVKPFKCEVCEKAFSRAHVRNEHMNIHTGKNPYVCTYCGKGFKRYANHFIHVYRHKLINGEVDKPEDKKLYLQLECKICNKIFASRGGLANHLALHQEEPREKKFLCYECGKGFITKAQLESHTRTHTGDRPYKCGACDKKFRQRSAYTNHQLVHSGEKPYQCELCAKLFTQSGHLKVHMRVHTGEKPFVCNFCGKSFALKSNLTVHTRIHTGETPYICSTCGLGYYDSTSLKKHMKSHGIGTPTHGHVKIELEPVKSTNKTL